MNVTPITVADDDFPQVFLSLALEYMARKGVNQMHLTIDAPENTAVHRGRIKMRTIVLDEIAEDASPSTDGLGGAFVLYFGQDDEDEDE